MARYFIGTSGWHYEDWRGRFYPEKMPKSRWLEFYTSKFSTVELNSSFYRLPAENTFTNWAKSTPPGFTFAVKVSRLITHLKRLRDSGESLETFNSRARLLGDKLGPLLYQLPPGLQRNDDLLETFVSGLPTDLQHVFEFRHESWFNEDIFKILRRHNVAFCVFNMPSLSSPVTATADFAYIRFHGSTGQYSSSYSDEELTDWAKKISGLAQGLKAVYIYFNNDVGGVAVENANTLRQLLKA